MHRTPARTTGAAAGTSPRCDSVAAALRLVDPRLQHIRMPNSRSSAWLALPLGAAAGSLATIIAALISPELYTDWGSLTGALVVIPLFATLAALLVTVPLTVLRRISWVGVPLALAVSIVAGELVFKATMGTGFARWSTARHWAAVELRAQAARDAAERDVCRRLLAQRPIPSPPSPPGAGVRQVAPTELSETGLIGFNRERCVQLLAR